MRRENVLARCALVILCLLSGSRALLSSGPPNACPWKRERTSSIQVYLSVSSLATTINETYFIDRQLELNWKNNATEEDDWVALYDTDPTNGSDLVYPLEKIWVVNRTEGYYRTSIQFPRYNFTIEDLRESRCLDHWIAYGRNESILASSCIQIRPQWMWELRDVIGNMSLSNLMIPGTHNAGSYQHYRGHRSENIFIRYNIYQEEHVGSQLLFGIRHFDFRIGYYMGNPHLYWLNHDKVKLNPFIHAIEYIKMFAENSKDILFLDFHRFPVGFHNRIDRHSEFMTYLVDELGEYLIPRSVGYDVTLNELWQMNKTIILFYSSDNYVFSPFLWRGLPQIWANTNRVSRLKSYFRDYISQSNRDPMWSAMSELTPTLWEALTTPKGSLRVLADQANRKVTHWFRDGWWREASIVATDFFLGNNIIEVAVDANQDRALCQSPKSGQKFPNL